MHQCLLVGLPATGKSTFIGALWHVVRRADIPGALALESLDAPVDHLNELSARWLSFEEADHTSSGAERISTIKLNPGKGMLAFDLVIPDFAGESIRHSLNDRQWTSEFADFVQNSSSVMVFVHPEQLKGNASIEEALEAADVNEQDVLNIEATDPPAIREWSAEYIPTQVHLVDLMQLLCEFIPFKSFRVAFIVSAWDLIDDLSGERILPQEWLAHHLPLLSQFLDCSSSRFKYRVFGVSAQGGKLPADREKLESHIVTSDRIIVVPDSGEVSHDISMPLRWAAHADPG